MPSRVFRTVKLASLIEHPLNKELYDECSAADLADSITQVGMVSPIVLAADGRTIISGHRRRKALLSAGIDEEEVIVDLDLDDDIDIRLSLIQSNKQRVKSALEIGREIRAVLALVEARSGHGSKKPVMDQLAEDHNISVSAAYRKVQLADAVDDALAEGNEELAETLAEHKSVPRPTSSKPPRKPAPPRQPRPSAEQARSLEQLAEQHDRAIADINQILQAFRHIMASPIGEYIGYAHTRLETHLNDAKGILSQLKPVAVDLKTGKFITRHEQESRQR